MFRDRSFYLRRMESEPAVRYLLPSGPLYSQHVEAGRIRIRDWLCVRH
jgi:hypothetical protein